LEHPVFRTVTHEWTVYPVPLQEMVKTAPAARENFEIS
jgi:hypothetical protein